MTHEFETKRPKEHPPVMSITDENEKLKQRIAELEANALGWLQANGPGGWINELRDRIADLEVQNTRLTASLETASSAVIMLKQQQREGWAQIASGQEPVAQWQKKHLLRTEGQWENTSEHAAKWWRDKAIGWESRPLYTRPTPAQQPLSDAEQRELVKECGLDWEKGSIPLFAGDTTNRYAVLIEAVERKHSIKEKP